MKRTRPGNIGGGRNRVEPAAVMLKVGTISRQQRRRGNIFASDFNTTNVRHDSRAPPSAEKEILLYVR